MHAFVFEYLRQRGIADRVCGWGKGIAVGARRIKRLNNPSNLHCFSGALTPGRHFVCYSCCSGQNTSSNAELTVWHNQMLRRAMYACNMRGGKTPQGVNGVWMTKGGKKGEVSAIPYLTR